MIERSAVVVVETGLGMFLVDAEARPWVHVMTLFLPHCYSFLPHCFSCMGIVSSSWLLVISGRGHRLREINSAPSMKDSDLNNQNLMHAYSSEKT
jgi:hypothetical protein